MVSLKTGRTAEEGAAHRQRTMQLRALHRLAGDQLPELGDALAALVRAEGTLVRDRGAMRRAAEQEAQRRHSRGVTTPGPYGEGYEAARRVMAALTSAHDELFIQG